MAHLIPRFRHAVPLGEDVFERQRSLLGVLLRRSMHGDVHDMEHRRVVVGRIRKLELLLARRRVVSKNRVISCDPVIAWAELS